jgi:hypothetical protein
MEGFPAAEVHPVKRILVQGRPTALEDHLPVHRGSLGDEQQSDTFDMVGSTKEEIKKAREEFFRSLMASEISPLLEDL